MSESKFLSQENQEMSQMDIAIQRIDALDELRIERTLISDVQGFQHVFQLLTLLIHYNHPNLPAYVEDAPQGIWQFSPTTYQQCAF